MTRLVRARGALAGAGLALAAAGVASGAGCTPATRYHEPRLAPGGAGSADLDATAAALAGEWAGVYDAPTYARRGTFELSLRHVVRGAGASAVSTVTGVARIRDAAARTPIAVDSARLAPGRVVLFLAPFADQETAATVRLRLDGALVADTLGGRLRVDAAATVPAEHRGGWRLVRVAPAATTARAP